MQRERRRAIFFFFFNAIIVVRYITEKRKSRFENADRKMRRDQGAHPVRNEPQGRTSSPVELNVITYYLPTRAERLFFFFHGQPHTWLDADLGRHVS